LRVAVMYVTIRNTTYGNVHEERRDRTWRSRTSSHATHVEPRSPDRGRAWRVAGRASPPTAQGLDGANRAAAAGTEGTCRPYGRWPHLRVPRNGTARPGCRQGG